MAKIRIRYFVKRPRQDGTMRYYWQPDGTLRAAVSRMMTRWRQWGHRSEIDDFEIVCDRVFVE